MPQLWEFCEHCETFAQAGWGFSCFLPASYGVASGYGLAERGPQLNRGATMPQPLRFRLEHTDYTTEEGTLEELAASLAERRRVQNIADGTEGLGEYLPDCAEDIISSGGLTVLYT